MMKSIVERVVLKWLLMESLGLIIITIQATNKTIPNLEKEIICSQVPSFCRYIQYSRKNRTNYLTESFRCEKGIDAESVKQLDQLLKSCRKKKAYRNVSLHISISIRAVRSLSIVNNSFRSLFELNTKKRDYDLRIHLKLLNLKGFDIDWSITGAYKDTYFVFYTPFNLYKQKQVIKSCRDFYDHNSTKVRQFIFRSGFTSFQINRPQALYPVCSLFFGGIRISSLQLSTMANSFYMKNSLSFVDEQPDDDPNHNHNTNNTKSLDSRIQILNLEKIYELDLDSKLLNSNIFALTDYIKIVGQLRSIEANVFTPIRKLRRLYITSDTILDLIRRQGIAWIKGINVNVSVNLTNLTDLMGHKNDGVHIEFSSERIKENNFNIGASKRNDNIEADFCLFVDFPFQQMVFLKPELFSRSIDLIIYKKQSLTCTQLWLYQYYKEIIRVYGYFSTFRLERKLQSSNFSACEFEKLIQICNRSQYHYSTTKRDTYASFDLIISLDFTFLIILSSLFSLVGIVTNTIVIIVISNKKNKKTMRKKQYIYMSLHCLFNVLICFIQFVNLLNECQYPYSRLFCSSVRHLVGIQYLRIIFGEYLNSLLRLVSNFAYFGFSICRLAKIGTNHSKFTKYVNEKLSIKVYMGVVVVISAGLCVCKCLQFNFNYDTPDLAYPLPFIQNPLRESWSFESGYLAIFVINIICNFINYFLFVFMHLIVDIVLIITLRRVMQEKEEKAREMKKSENEMEKISKENEESKRRAVLMVICNSSVNFCLKIPLLIPALNDFRLFIYNSYRFGKVLTATNKLNLYSSPFNFEFYCATEKSCQIFQSFGNCLFLASLSTILFFLKHFDMNFKSSFSNVFNRLDNQNSHNAIFALSNLPAN